jgi:hypothetical protein
MKKFEELSIPLQKKRIVRDAIAQIQAGVIVPTEGEYFYLPDTHGEKDLQTILKRGETYTCEACAKGSLFASCVISTNEVSTRDSLGSESFQSNKLKKWFSYLELDMIETAFEKEIITDNEGALRNEYGNENTLAKSCVRFGKRFKSDKNRLLAILNNILKNGTFKPDKK